LWSCCSSRGGVSLGRSIEPASHVDGRWYRQALVGQSAFHIRQRAAIGNMRIKVIVPELNGAVAHLTGNADLVEERRGPDGAGVEAVAHAQA